jgi:hypothetical protein
MCIIVLEGVVINTRSTGSGISNNEGYVLYPKTSGTLGLTG